MLSSDSLRKCIDLLADINAEASSNKTRGATLEIGYILKKELDTVVDIERVNKTNRPINPQEILKDNVQLFNENKKLLDENIRLKNLIESKFGEFTNRINELNAKIERLVSHNIFRGI